MFHVWLSCGYPVLQSAFWFELTYETRPILRGAKSSYEITLQINRLNSGNVKADLTLSEKHFPDESRDAA